MCGIFGAIKYKGFFDSKDHDFFVKLTDMVSYRGPDSSGYIACNTANHGVNNVNRFNVFFGHRRLSIIDLSKSANQPFSDQNGKWVIYNGEVFNYIELKEDLERKGYVFRSNSDTEVVLNIYKNYGETGFKYMNGMWALAILDIPNKKIVLSRDRFSIKPLYYIQTDEHFYFSSEIKQLLPLLKNKEVCEKVMFQYIEQNLLDYNNETFFKDIYKLKPKHNLVINLESFKILNSKYWDYSIDDGIQNISFDSLVERFRELFIDSVRIRLRSDVKVGALLSGGLDSSAISVIANTFQSDSFFTYSVISKHAKYSEEKYIDHLSEKTNINNSKIVFDIENDDSIISYIEQVIYHNDEPFSSLSTVAQFKVLEALKANSDITVVLSGQGGDEILMGYLKYFFFNVKKLLRDGDVIQAASEVLSSLLKKTAVWQFKLAEARRYMPSFAKRTPKAFLNLKEALEPVWIANDLMERQILDIDKYSVPSLTHYEDRNSMAHSLEIRLPFLDHRLVDFVLNLPVNLKLHGGWSKYVLRKSLPELPDMIRWRKDKQGFIIPEELWMKKQFSVLINNLFEKSLLDKMGIINSKLFLEYYRSYQNGNKSIWYTDISRVLIAEAWARKFFNNEQLNKYLHN